MVYLSLQAQYRPSGFLPSHHEVNVSERPVTGAGGLATIEPQSQYTKVEFIGRQVQDASFFLGYLRTKENQIVAEMETLQLEIERLEKECHSMKDNENTNDDLLVEVRELEGILADYNLAMDKARSGTDSEDIIKFQKQLELDNSTLANDIDHIFIIRQQKRKDISEIEAKINDMHVTLQNKIQCSKDIEKIQEYNGLKLSFQNLHSEGKERENEIDNLRKQISDFQSSMLQ